jgi:RecB family exonuclease
MERGLLLHEVMHRIWSGQGGGIRSHAELISIPDLTAFVADHVRRALLEKTPIRARDSMPARYLELEGERLTVLILSWLEYERARVPFLVEQTEAKANPTIADLTLRLRLDRVDRLNDGSLLVIDYKTGDVATKVWDLPRPDDVQLPLYAGFAVDPAVGQIGGIAFARLRAGKCEFKGRVRAARATLDSALRANNSLVKQPLTLEDLAAWHDEIESLAHDFLAGRAYVNPREYPTTCQYCELKALCRVQEMRDAGDVNDNENCVAGNDE